MKILENQLEAEEVSEETEVEEVALEKIHFLMKENSERKEGLTMISKANKTDLTSNHKENSESLEVDSEVTMVNQGRKETLKIDNNQEEILKEEEAEAEADSEEVSKVTEVEEVASEEAIEEVLKDTMTEVKRN